MVKNIMQVKPVNSISEAIIARRAAEKAKEIENDRVRSSVRIVPTPWYIKCFKEFCSSTAMHGYSYIIREDSHKWER